jgi:beta-glucosidase
MQMLNKMKLSVLALSVAMTLGLASCGGGGGGGHDDDGAPPVNPPVDPPVNPPVNPPVEPPYTGHSWFDPAIIAEQNAAPTNEAKEAIARTRAKELIAAMSEDQKLSQLTGARGMTNGLVVPELPDCKGARHVLSIPELGVQTVRITNGPVGVGQNDCVSNDAAIPEVDPSSAKATALPSAIAMAASFDRNMAKAYGDLIASEMNDLALHVFEAPGANMARIPNLGRNFEYLGEDPYLSGTMAAEESKAIQAAGLVAMPKHFIGNEQEALRNSVNAVIDDQVMREIYLIPFEMAVKDAKVSSIMCAYNDLNGVQACESDATLNKILRDEWGFTGYVQTDFGAAKSTAGTLLGGLDHEMNTATWWTPVRMRAALDDPATGVTWALIDRALERRFTQLFKLGILDRPIKQTPIDFAANGEKAREIGVKSAVLLKNNNAFLPLPENLIARNPSYGQTSADWVTIIGKVTQPFAQRAVQGGSQVNTETIGGSSDVMPEYTVSPVNGIADGFGASLNSGKVKLILVDDDNQWASVNGAPMTFANAIANYINKDENKAIIIMAGTMAEEGGDRSTIEMTYTGLPPGTPGAYCGYFPGCAMSGYGTNASYPPASGLSLDWYTKGSPASTTSPSDTGNNQTMAMIDQIFAVNASLKNRTVLVLKDNASISVPNRLIGANGPASILEVWFPGQEDGNIVADLLLGKVNPSGKLPVTFAKEGQGFMDSVTPEQYPGTMVAGKPTVVYSEKLNMGYRWYDANVSGGCTESNGENDCVAFPFGYGLSYTSFALSNASVAANSGKYDVKVRVSNTGSIKGAEVVQVYLQLPSSANAGRLAQPPKRLVGFTKLEVEAGAQQDVTITIDPDASNHPLSVWDEATHAWHTPAGSYTVLVGNSSSPKDLTQAGTFAR